MEIRRGRYRAHFAAGAEDIARALALRRAAFRGGGATDADAFDSRAAHLLVETRDDGRLVTVSGLLYLVAAHLDGRRTDAEVAALVAAADGRDVDADDIAYLLEHKLGPLGLVERETSQVRIEAAAADSSMLALRMRVRMSEEK